MANENFLGDLLNFKFEPVSLSDIELGVRLLNPKKAATHKNIPPKIAKSSSETRLNVLHETILNVLHIHLMFSIDFSMKE